MPKLSCLLVLLRTSFVKCIDINDTITQQHHNIISNIRYKHAIAQKKS